MTESCMIKPSNSHLWGYLTCLATHWWPRINIQTVVTKKKKILWQSDGRHSGIVLALLENEKIGVFTVNTSRTQNKLISVFMVSTWHLLSLDAQLHFRGYNIATNANSMMLWTLQTQPCPFSLYGWRLIIPIFPRSGLCVRHVCVSARLVRKVAWRQSEREDWPPHTPSCRGGDCVQARLD